MDRKKLIQIVVIVMCLGGSVVVLYRGFFKKPIVNVLPPAATTVQTEGGAGGAFAAETILPYGDDLEGELKRVLSRNNLQYQTVILPKFDPAEVGISTNDLVKPLPAGEETAE